MALAGSVAVGEPPADQYPDIRLESEDNLNLPDSGTLVIQYKKTHEQVSNKGKDNEIYSCTLEVHKLLEVKGNSPKAPSTRDMGAEDALDKLAKEKSEQNEADDQDEE